MQLIIKAQGTEKVHRRLPRLPKYLLKHVMKYSDEFMKAVQKSAKLRMKDGSKAGGRWTGALAASVHKGIPKTGKDAGSIVITVGVNPVVPYAAAQEYGFKRHKIGAGRATRKGKIFGDWLYAHDKGDFGGAYVSKPIKKGGYYLGPAIRKNLNDLKNGTFKGVKEAVRKAGFK